MKHSKLALILASLSLMLVIPSVSRAQEEKPEPAVNLFTGASVVFGLPDQGALMGYGSVGVAVLIPVRGRFAIIPGGGFEIAPKMGNFGPFCSVAFDFALSDVVALDLIVGLAYDYDPVLGQEIGKPHQGYVMAGPGLSFLLPNGMSVAPALLYSVNLQGLGHFLSPSVSVNIPLP